MAGGGAEEEVETVGTVDLTFWTFIDIHADFYESMAEEFNRQSDDVQIRLETSVIPMNQMHDQLLLSLASGRGAPDISDVMIRWAGQYFKGTPDYFLDLTDLVEPHRDVMHAERLTTYTDMNGRVRGLPTHIGAGVMYYNRTKLEEAGIDIDSIETYDDWVAVGQQVTRPEDDVWFTSQHYAFAREFLLYTMQKGGYMVDPDGNVTVDGPEAKEALQFIKDTLDTYEIATLAPNASFYDPAFFDAMNNERFLSVPHAQWYNTRFRNFMPDLEGDMVMRPLPAWGDGQGHRSATMGGTGTAVTAQSEHPEVAKRFLEFVKLSYEGNIGIATEFGMDPPRLDVYDDERLQREDPYFSGEITMNVIRDVLDDTVAKPVWPVSTDIQTALSRDILPAVLDGDLSVDEALDSLAAQYATR